MGTGLPCMRATKVPQTQATTTTLAVLIFANLTKAARPLGKNTDPLLMRIGRARDAGSVGKWEAQPLVCLTCFHPPNPAHTTFAIKTGGGR